MNKSEPLKVETFTKYLNFLVTNIRDIKVIFQKQGGSTHPLRSALFPHCINTPTQLLCRRLCARSSRSSSSCSISTGRSRSETVQPTSIPWISLFLLLLLGSAVCEQHTSYSLFKSVPRSVIYWLSVRFEFVLKCFKSEKIELWHLKSHNMCTDILFWSR